MLNSILIAKAKQEQNLKLLIEDFIKENKTQAYKQSKTFLNDLTVFIYNKFDNVNKEILSSLISQKIKEFNIKINLDDIDDIYEKVAHQSKKHIKNYDFSFDGLDVKAINSTKSSFIWLMDDTTNETAKEVKKSIESIFKGDLNKQEASKILNDKFGKRLDKNVSYFEGVSNHIINQNQNTSTVAQALKYKVQYFKVNARLDSRTSRICRSMHGRIIEASHVEKQLNNILKATTKETKSKASAWKAKPVFGKLPSNFGIPPYHYKCRTQLLPVYENTEMIDGKKVIYFGEKNKDSVFEHVDKTGIQRRINSDTLKKLKRKHNLSEKEIIAGLNDIQEIGSHVDDKLRSVAKTGNGLFFSFEGDKIITAFRPNKKANKYFSDFAIKQTREIIKWLRHILSS